MLFAVNRRRLTFFLQNLSDTEHASLTKLIRDNGGGISTSREFPVITLSNGHNDTNDYPVFHVNFIKECIKRGKLLNLIHFKLGPSSFWGCLGCIFAHTQRTCPHLDDITPCFTSTQIDSCNDYSPPISADHDYAQLPSTLHETSTSTDFDDPLFSLDETLGSPITVSENINWIPEPMVENATQEIPEPSAFEELCSNEIIPGSDESDDENTNQAEESYSKIETTLDQRSVTNNDKVHRRLLLISVNAIEVHPFGAVEKEIETCNDELKTIEQDNRNRMSDISRCSRVSTALMSERSSSRIVQNSRTSPTIPRDRLNNINILGLGHRRDSSDSDDTNYELLTDSEYSQNKKEKETNNNVGKNHKFKIRRKISDSSRMIVYTDTDEDTVKTERTSKQETTASKKNEINTKSTSSWITRGSTPHKNSADSSIKSPDDLTSISDSDSSSSDCATTSALSRVRKFPSAKAEHANSSQFQKVKHIQPSRNFLPWEQREMVRYLIDNNCIAEARGNQVWKQLIADGFLPHRTFHSLNNHFRKFILPIIGRFKMHSEHAKQFRKLQSS